MDWGLIVVVQDRFKLGQMDFQIQVQTVLKEDTNIRIITVDQDTCSGVVLGTKCGNRLLVSSSDSLLTYRRPLNPPQSV